MAQNSIFLALNDLGVVSTQSWALVCVCVRARARQSVCECVHACEGERPMPDVIPKNHSIWFFEMRSLLGSWSS